MDKQIPNLVKSTKDLASLVKLEQEASMQKTPEELYDFIVHKSRQIISYDFGVLWIKSNNEFVKFTDVDLDGNNTPIIELLKNIVKKKRKEPIEKLEYSDFSGHHADLAKEHLFKHSVAVELVLHGQVVGLLILSRNEAWHKRETVLLDNLRYCYALCLGCLNPNILKKAIWKKTLSKLSSRTSILVIIGIVIAALFIIQVPLTVLAPAEVVSKKPIFIRSEAEGVIEKVHIPPNSFVKKGQKLVSLNKETIESQLNILEKKLALVVTQHKIASKSGLSDNKQKEKIPVYKMEIQKNIAEIEYYKYLLQQTDIFAPQSGLVIFDQTHKLEGKPVRTGENIMLLSDEKEGALDIFLPVNDAIDFKKDGVVKFFLNTAPRDPLTSKITYSSYQAEVTPDGVLAYQIRASFDGLERDELPRIGLRGSAKLYGEEVPLIYYLLRKPLSYLRRKIGF
jgi:hypothetical protein